MGDDRAADREGELQMEIRSLSSKVVGLEAEMGQLRSALDRKKEMRGQQRRQITTRGGGIN